ncbi:Gluconokinase [Rhodovulum sp. PH10]|uniref:gluconokinase n=1 Tax=Rhodovulum sp. PH10 TaxID=1187851 RepID=UPI00027C2C01|nr:gluconokinase [Rhodovulum sp. PH10]EJW12455.1 Gluconokinase [Rhodovulum sp. PH10]
MIVVVMGVSGSGKTTVGRLLAARLGCGFSDADDFHPAANIEKMRAGIPLTDADRRPWLDAIHAAMVGFEAAGEDRVIACSALAASYRERLAPRGEAVFVLLTGSAALLATRLAGRVGHFFAPSLLASQLATLEVPDDAIVIDVAPPPDVIVDEIFRRLALCRLHPSRSAAEDDDR